MGVRQRDAGIVNNRGSVYMVKIEYPQAWITEMSRIYNNIINSINSNLSDDEKKQSLNYIRTFLFHCKVGAVRGNIGDFKPSGNRYLWAAPYKFKYILVSGFPDVFQAEHRFGDYLTNNGLWILGEYFRFSSLELMKKALCKLINTHYQAVGQAIVGARGIQINDLVVHDLERDYDDAETYTAYQIELSTIEELIERGVITAGEVRDLMIRNAYRFANVSRIIEARF